MMKESIDDYKLCGLVYKKETGSQPSLVTEL